MITTSTNVGITVAEKNPARFHEGLLYFFGRYSWVCVNCGANGSHPLGQVAPLEHEIGAQCALEPFTPTLRCIESGRRMNKHRRKTV